MDEAVSLAKAVAAASPNALVLALAPMLQASTEQTVIAKRRRTLEDLMLAQLDVHCGLLLIYSKELRHI